MGNRITFDEICQQLCSIYRVTLCCFQNEVQNDSPYLVRYGQLESVIGNLSKEAADGFIRFKSLHCTQNVILHHCQSEASNLSGKMYRLAFAKVQQGLTILVCNFGSPSSGINTIRFKEAKRKVCGQQRKKLCYCKKVYNHTKGCRSYRVSWVFENWGMVLGELIK